MDTIIFTILKLHRVLRVVFLITLVYCFFGNANGGNWDDIFSRSQRVKDSMKGSYMARLPVETKRCKFGMPLPDSSLEKTPAQPSCSKHNEDKDGLRCAEFPPKSEILPEPLKFDNQEQTTLLLRLRHVIPKEDCDLIVKNSTFTALEKVQLQHLENEEFTKALWDKISEYIPHAIEGHRVLGLHRKFWFVRTGVIGFNDIHTDDFKVLSDYSQFSLFTVLLYLNDNTTSDLRGGDLTLFDIRNSSLIVTMEAGSVVIFPANISHSIAPISQGLKYFLRNEIWVENKFRECI